MNPNFKTLVLCLSILTCLTLHVAHGNSDIKATYNYTVKTIEVPLDHFNFANNKTFKLRYLINDQWENGKNPPIFFYTGNEGSIELFAENTGFMWEIAPNFGAVLVFAEHRYYGKSMPFGNESLSNENAGYLSSQQAMADYVDLIQFLKTSSPKYKNSAVVAFGGSYGGMLSAWMRLKYPHIIQGAIASSAPILQFTGIVSCDVFMKIVTYDYKRSSSVCSELIRKSWDAITNIASTDEGKKWIFQNWRFCTPLKNSTDIQTFKDYLSNVYTNLAMVNYPYPTNFLAPLPAYPISAFCKHLANSSLQGKPLLSALRDAVSVYTNYTEKTSCIDINDANGNLDAAGWDYQACTEMVMPMCSDGVTDMFPPSPWDFKKYSKDCVKKFGIKPQADLACKQYGCTDLKAYTNIVFSNGLLDPWSSGGVLRNLSPSAVAVVIPEGAHHLDLRSSDVSDPESVIQVRKFHISSIQKWIKWYWEEIESLPKRKTTE